MKTRFIVDVGTGVITETIGGAAVPAARVGLFTARDIMDVEVVFMAGSEDITAAVIEVGMQLKLGLRRVTGDGLLLAQSEAHTMAAGVANCVLNTNTDEIKALVDEITKPDQLFAKVFFEVEISKADGSYRQTVAQQQFTMQFEVNMEGDEPPAAAAQSALTAGQHADRADAAASLAEKWAQSETSPDGSEAKSAKKHAEDAGNSANAAGNSAVAAGNSSNAANQAKLDAQAAATAAANAVAETFDGAVAGNAVPTTATAKGYYYRITADGTTAGITSDGVTPIVWQETDSAVYTGTPGRYVRLAGQAGMDATDLPFTPDPAGSLQSTNIGDALNELDSDKASRADLGTIADSIKSVDVQVFNASAVWAKPVGAKVVQIIAKSGGAGGGSGARRAAGYLSQGGGGGGGGGARVATFPASMLGASEAVTVGAGGVGGASITVNDSNGADGTDGGDSAFGAWVTVRGGSKGTGGGNGSSTRSQGGSGGGLGYSFGTNVWHGVGGGGGGGDQYNGGSAEFGGGGGGPGYNSYWGANSGGSSVCGAGGGGGGGGVNTSNATQASSDGGIPGWYGTDLAHRNPGGSAQNPGADAPAPSATITGGGGGGGGGGLTAAAGRGGNGAPVGGGGGGGGGSRNGYASGAGGNGGAGRVIVISYF